MGWYIIIGTLPIAIAGVLLEETIQTTFRNLWVIGANLIIFGLILGIADRLGANERPLDRLNLRDALLYGGAQMLALVPGVSRSGATISMGLGLGYRREAATRYAFLLAIPAVVASAIFQLPDVSASAEPGMAKTLVATVVAFFVGYAVIAWLLRYLRTRSFLPFVIYRVALGALVLILLSVGVLDATVSV
jgi:undecaprenyl-diphosphatase